MEATGKNIIHPSGAPPERDARTDIRTIGVYGKKFTDLLVRAPTLFMVMAAIVPFVLAIIGIMQTSDYDLTTSGFEITYHATTAKARAATLSAEALWREDRARSFAIKTKNTTATMKLGMFRTTPQMRQYIQYRINPTKAVAANPTENANLLSANDLLWIRDLEAAVRDIK